MSRTRYVIAGAIIAVLLLVFFFRSTGARAAGGTDIVTSRARRADFTKTVTSSGKTKAAKSAELKFQTSGKLVWVGVKEGQQVKPGQAIAQLDSRDVAKNLEKSLRDYSKQRNDFDQMQRVTYNGITRPSDALTDTVKRILEKNQWDLEKSVLDVELKHLSLEYATLYSPIGGIVTRVDTPIAGINVTPAGAVFSVVDPGSIVFEAKIDEVDVGKLKVGQPATIMLDAFPESTFSGKIVTIAYAAETSAGGATVFPVTVAFDAPDTLRIGFNGDITVETENIPGQVLVPASAIREENNKKYVYTKTGKSFKKVFVKTGPSNDNDTVVVSGVAPDDDIVVKGFAGVVVKK